MGRIARGRWMWPGSMWPGSAFPCPSCGACLMIEPVPMVLRRGGFCKSVEVLQVGVLGSRRARWREYGCGPDAEMGGQVAMIQSSTRRETREGGPGAVSSTCLRRSDDGDPSFRMSAGISIWPNGVGCLPECFHCDAPCQPGVSISWESRLAPARVHTPLDAGSPWVWWLARQAIACACGNHPSGQPMWSVKAAVAPSGLALGRQQAPSSHGNSHILTLSSVHRVTVGVSTQEWFDLSTPLVTLKAAAAAAVNIGTRLLVYHSPTDDSSNGRLRHRVRMVTAP